MRKVARRQSREDRLLTCRGKGELRSYSSGGVGAIRQRSRGVRALSPLPFLLCRCVSFVHSAGMRSQLSEARPRSFLIIEAARPILTASAITASTRTPRTSSFQTASGTNKRPYLSPSAFRDQTVREYHPDKDGSSNGHDEPKCRTRAHGNLHSPCVPPAPTSTSQIHGRPALRSVFRPLV
jgi:hypothetical protein